MIALLAFVVLAAAPAAPATRAIDPSVPTAVPAPEGAEVEIDGAAIIDEPELGPEPVVVAPKPAPVPPKPSEKKPRWPETKRRGVVVFAAIGAGGCTQDQCKTLKAVPWFSLTGGYRFGRFAPILTVQGGAGPAKPAGAVAVDGEVIQLSSAKDSRRFFNLGVGTLLHLLVTTPFDPYFGLTIGYFRTRVRFTGRGTSTMGATYEINGNEVVHRGTLGIIIGMGFRIRQRLTIGPRVDVLVPFAGKTCVRQGDGSDPCFELSQIEGVDPGQFFPRPWAATLQFGAVI